MSTPTNDIVVTESNAASLVSTLLDRGYFLSVNGSCFALPSSDDKGDTVSCTPIPLVSRHDGHEFCTLDALREDFLRLVDEKHRLSLDETAHLLGVSQEILRVHIFPQVSSSDVLVVASTSNSIQVTVVGTAYLESRIDNVLASMSENKTPSPPVPLSSLARDEFELPLDVVVPLLEEKLVRYQRATAFPRLLRRDDGAQVLSTRVYWESFQAAVLDVFSQASQQPIYVERICQENNWNLSWVKDTVMEKQQGGEWHEKGSDPIIYLPPSYLAYQQELIQEVFARQGYVTMAYATEQFGETASMTRIKQACCSHGAASHNGVRFLPHTVVQTAVIVEPMLEAIREAFDQSGWIDLQEFLPLELWEHHPDDARVLVEDAVGADKVVLHIDKTAAVVFSNRFWEEFRQGKLVELIQSFASSEAKALIAKRAEGEASTVCSRISNIVSAKAKHKARTSQKQAQDFDDDAINSSLIPLRDVVEALLDGHMGLASLFKDTDTLGVLCQDTLYGEVLESACAKAIRKELTNMLQEPQSAAPATVVIQRNVPEDLSSNIQASFEDSHCFANSCYILQAEQKFLQHVAKNIAPAQFSALASLQRGLVYGSCKNFVWRLTEYSLFQNNVEDATFSFEGKGPALFYSPIDLTQRDYPAISLKCDHAEDALKALRKALPNGAGAMLADLWVQCTDDVEGAEVIDLSDRIDRLLALAKENALTICGIPFKLLDKKSEKKFLSLRRQKLVEAIESADELDSAIDLCLMLLYQQTKNTVVSVTATNRQTVIELLSKERKAPLAQISLVQHSCQVQENASRDIGDEIDRLRKNVLQ